MDKKERTKVVVDETTIYEIDLDCMECKRDEDNKNREKKRNVSVRKDQM